MITLPIMTSAIKNKLKLHEKKAKKIALFVMDTFGYESRIIDNILKPEDRQLFYMLEAEGFLSTGRERTRLHDGREWMTHYWQLKYAEIYRFAENNVTKLFNQNIKKQKSHVPKITIYSSLSEELWQTRKILNH
jgi:hypothetical protein